MTKLAPGCQARPLVALSRLHAIVREVVSSSLAYTALYPRGLRGTSCPFCDHPHLNGMIHTPERGWYFCYLPTMKLQAPDMTKNCSEEWEQLRSPCIVATACPASVGQFTSFLQQPAKQRVEVIPRVRHYASCTDPVRLAASSKGVVCSLHQGLADASAEACTLPWWMCVLPGRD